MKEHDTVTQWRNDATKKCRDHAITQSRTWHNDAVTQQRTWHNDETMQWRNKAMTKQFKIMMIQPEDWAPAPPPPATIKGVAVDKLAPRATKLPPPPAGNTVYMLNKGSISWEITYVWLVMKAAVQPRYSNFVFLPDKTRLASKRRSHRLNQQ